MANRTTPPNWSKIVAAIKSRAVYRCECGTIWDCGSGAHPARCQNRDGGRYQDNGREVRLRVVQIGKPDDYRPEYLVALCLRCLKTWEEQRRTREEELNLAKTIEGQSDPLLDLPTEGQNSDHNREQN